MAYAQQKTMQTAKAYALHYTQTTNVRGMRLYKNIHVGYTWNRDRAYRWSQLIDCGYNDVYLTEDEWVEVDA